jgi:hypothetical protein
VSPRSGPEALARAAATLASLRVVKKLADKDGKK